MDNSDANLENMLEKTEMRNKILQKMNKSTDKNLKDRKEALLSSMVT